RGTRRTLQRGAHTDVAGEPVVALCARSGLHALQEAQEEMTVRDTAAATGVKESTLRHVLRGLPKEGRADGEEEPRPFAMTSSGHSRLKLRQTALTLSCTRLTIR